MSLAISANSSRSPGTTSSASLAPEKAFAAAPTRSEPVALGARRDSFEPSDPSSSSDPHAEADRDAVKPSKKASAESKAIGRQLTPDQLQVISNLQARDREVRAHEAAHQAAGGGAVGGASYSYQQGPDGRQYAIGGEVSVDLSASGSPEAVIAKMARVRAAATAPASPSSQDFSVAAAAARQEQRAQVVTEQTAAAETKQKKAEATAEPDAHAAQSDSPASHPPESKSADHRTQQRAVSAYQTSAGAATSRSINQHA